MKKVSIEYAHIYTNNHIGDEQKFSLEILGDIAKEYTKEDISLVVMVDDYSFPDPSFNYSDFSEWLSIEGFSPDIVLRESQLIPVCDEVLKIVDDPKLKEQISDYIRSKKYPCSLFVATWYLIRLGKIENSLFKKDFVSERLINILPVSFKPFEEKAFDIIRSTKFKEVMGVIENRYFEGRLLA